MFVDLLIQLGLDRLEQVPINDQRLLAREGLALEGHISDIKAIAKQISEGTPREGNTADGPARLQSPHVTMPRLRRSAISRLRLPSLR